VFFGGGRGWGGPCHEEGANFGVNRCGGETYCRARCQRLGLTAAAHARGHQNELERVPLASDSGLGFPRVAMRRVRGGRCVRGGRRVRGG